MKYKPPRERERGRRKAEPQTQGPWAPACTLQPSPSELGPPRVLPGWVPVGEERAELGLGLQAGEQGSPPTELPHPPALPLSPSFPPPLLFFYFPHWIFIFLRFFFSFQTVLSTIPSISPSSFLFPLPSALHLSLSTHCSPQPCLPSPQVPGLQEGALIPPRSPQRQKVPCQQNAGAGC